MMMITDDTIAAENKLNMILVVGLIVSSILTFIMY